MIRLNLGCGKHILKGYKNIDIKKFNKEVEIQDLNKTPYPYKTNSVDQILISHTLEHLKNPIKVIKELIRITKPKHTITIKVPHLTRGQYTPLHKHTFTLAYIQTLKEEKIITNKIKIETKLKWMRDDDIRNRKTLEIIDKVINKIINKNKITKHITEKFIASYIGGIEEIEFKITKQK